MQIFKEINKLLTARLTGIGKQTVDRHGKGQRRQINRKIDRQRCKESESLVERQAERGVRFRQKRYQIFKKLETEALTDRHKHSDVDIRETN